MRIGCVILANMDYICLDFLQNVIFFENLEPYTMILHQKGHNTNGGKI